jgi:multiple sugar transport system substrate-binding protein
MKRTIIGMFLVLLMVVSVSNDVVSAAQVTIRVWTFLNPNGQTGREKALKQIITGFEAANPEIKVRSCDFCQERPGPRVA